MDWEQEVPDDNDNVGELGRYAFDAAHKGCPMRALAVRIGEVTCLEDGRIRQEGCSPLAEGVPNRLLEQFPIEGSDMSALVDVEVVLETAILRG